MILLYDIICSQSLPRVCNNFEKVKNKKYEPYLFFNLKKKKKKVNFFIRHTLHFNKNTVCMGILK